MTLRWHAGLLITKEAPSLPPVAAPFCQVPPGFDLQLHRRGQRRARVELHTTPAGILYLRCGQDTIPLGRRTELVLEPGWWVGGLHLRGALHFPQHGLTLSVPDREDLPYLAHALTRTVTEPLALAA